MKVSVIIPTYNRADLLMETLESLANQQYPPKLFEIIIVDNNSNDFTKKHVKDFIDKYKSVLNIKYILEKRKGATFARHTGSINSTGSILCFCDDDGVYERNWISKITEAFLKRPEVASVGTKILIKWDKTPPEWIHEYEELLGKKETGQGVFFGKDIYINAGSFSIKKDIFRELHGFGPDLVGDYLIGDGETTLNRKILEAGYLVGFTNETTMWHRQFVDKNATYEDMGRRYANDGIAEAYGDFIIMGKNPSTILKKIFMLLFLLYALPVYIIFMKRKYIKTYFKVKFLISYLMYFARYKTDKNFRRILIERNWELNDRYSSPEPELLTSINDGF